MLPVSVLKGSEMEKLQIINLILTTITGSFTVATLICRPFRNWLLNAAKEKKAREEEEDRLAETERCLLRDRITSIYFKHCDDSCMRQYEFENLTRLYTQYKKLNGNSFIDKLWDEMQEWHIIK